MTDSHPRPLEAPPDDSQGHRGRTPEADSDGADPRAPRDADLQDKHGGLHRPSAGDTTHDPLKWSIVADSDDAVPDAPEWATFEDEAPERDEDATPFSPEWVDDESPRESQDEPSADEDVPPDATELSPGDASATARAPEQAAVHSDEPRAVPEWTTVAESDKEEEAAGESPPASARPAVQLAVEEHRIRTDRSGRVFAFGGAEAVGELWIVLHGYGQLARSFSGEVSALNSAERRVVVPEALSRYYLSGTDGPVGASWMTREDREHEITDYIAYLDAVYDYSVQGLAEQPQIHVLGFSQGAETAARWALMGKARVHRLVLWGGRLPADLDVTAHREALRRLRLTIVHGTEDTFATPERIAEQEEQLNRHMIAFHTVTFEGGHRLDSETLAWLVED